MKVDRTCKFCGIDRVSLCEFRFYDFTAIHGESEYPIVHGGYLNRVLICGSQDCANKAMDRRKQELLC